MAVIVRIKVQDSKTGARAFEDKIFRVLLFGREAAEKTALSPAGPRPDVGFAPGCPEFVHLVPYLRRIDRNDEAK